MILILFLITLVIGLLAQGHVRRLDAGGRLRLVADLFPGASAAAARGRQRN